MRLISTLLLLLAVKMLFSQGPVDSGKAYLVLFYVKPMPGQHHEYIKAENEIFGPMHQQVVNAGNMINWSVFWVQTSTEYSRDYDFVVLRSYRSLEDMEKDTPNAFELAHPGKNFDSLVLPSFKTRDSPRREIWEIDTSLISHLTGKFAGNQFLMYFGKQSFGFPKAVKQLISKKAVSQWESYSLLIPDGNLYPYKYLSIGAVNDVSNLPKILPLPLAAGTVKQELWSKWGGTE